MYGQRIFADKADEDLMKLDNSDEPEGNCEPEVVPRGGVYSKSNFILF